jgi:hypothetical protein
MLTSKDDPAAVTLEDRSYRHYLGEKHKEYRPFTETKPKEQTAYWNWRHSHPDHDNGR